MVKSGYTASRGFEFTYKQTKQSMDRKDKRYSAKLIRLARGALIAGKATECIQNIFEHILK